MYAQKRLRVGYDLNEIVNLLSRAIAQVKENDRMQLTICIHPCTNHNASSQSRAEMPFLTMINKIQFISLSLFIKYQHARLNKY